MADTAIVPVALSTPPADADVVREAGERGRLEILPRAIERIAQIAASRVDSVDRHRTNLARKLPRADAVLAGARVRIKLEVAAVWGRPLADIADEVRRDVARIVAELTGLTVDAVDVEISTVTIHTTTDQANRRVL